MLLCGLGVGREAPAQETVQMQIKPRLCILQSGEEQCRDRIEVRWSTEQTYSVCLFEQGVEVPLSCWEASRSGVHNTLLVTADDTEFLLVETPGRRVLASRAFEVVADAQRYRRRRRNPWSFF